jgi:uncharacterized protein YjiK
MRIFSRALAACVAMFASGCDSTPKEFELGGFHYSIDAFEQWKLPKSLREISGLAVTPDGRLFAHGDEHGVVHQLDYHGGRLVKSFALARANGKPLKRDFEGITAAGDDLFMVTSDGTLLRFKPGQDGDKVAFQTIDTGSGSYCEVEGLAYQPPSPTQNHALLLACKDVFGKRPTGDVVILSFSLETSRLDPQRRIVIAGQQIAAALGSTKPLSPSGIAISPRSGNLLLVAARQGAVMEATADGTLVSVFRWPMERYHRQTEGIVQLNDGTLLVADEGNKKRGRLGVYRAIN